MHATALVRRRDRGICRTRSARSRRKSAQVKLLVEALEDRRMLATWFVDDGALGANSGGDWANAFTSPQDALALADAGDQIWVAEGTYLPTTDGNRSVSFTLTDAHDGISIYGGFAGHETSLAERDWVAHPTILSGDIGTLGDTTDNSYHVVYTTGASSALVLDGFTITDGNANDDWNADGRYGGGMFNYASSPALTNVALINNRSSAAGGGMYNAFSSPTLNHVILTGNTAINGAGIYNAQSSPLLIDVTLTRNIATYSGGGIFNGSSSSPSLTNVLLAGNVATMYYGGGIRNDSYSSPTLTNVTLAHNSAPNGGGMYNTQSSPTLTNVIVWGNTNSGIQDVVSTSTITYSILQDAGYPGPGNFMADPLFVDPAAGNFHLRPASFAIDRGTIAGAPSVDLDGRIRPLDGDGNGVPLPDIGAYEYPENVILHVRQGATGLGTGLNWTDAYPSLQTALAVSNAGDEIWVAAGTYRPTTSADRTISFSLKNAVALYGGFAGTETAVSQRDWQTNVTTLSGNIGASGGSDNSYHVLVAGSGIASALDGFAVEGGNANGGSTFYDGGGLRNSGSVTLTNVTLRGNSADYGGAISNMGSLVVSHSVIAGNSASSGGGGIMNWSSTLSLLESILADNTTNGLGGGIYFSNPSLGLVRNSILVGNTCNYHGGAIYSQGSNLTVMNSTIVSNQAVLASYGSGGGIYSNSDTLALANSIVWGNHAALSGHQLHIVPGSTSITYNDIEGGWAGTGNLNANPLFVDFAGRDFELKGVSPAIDAGTAAGAPGTDIVGTSRPIDGNFDGAAAIDMGAYEYLNDAPLVVTGLVPGANSLSSPASVVSVTFDRPISFPTLTDETLAVHGGQSGHVQSPPATLSASDDSVTLDPAASFHAGELIEVTATRGLEDASGHTLAHPFVWQFRAEVAPSSGLFVVSSQNFSTAATPDVAIGDLDGDGDLDAVLAHNEGLNRYINDGSGQFVSAGGTFGGPVGASRLTLGDVDRDGDLDLLSATAGYQSAKLWLNDGTGSFGLTPAQSFGTSGGGVYDTALADFDGDGDLDLFLACGSSLGSYESFVYLNDGAGHFAFSSTPLFSRDPSIAAGDVDADGDLDLVVADASSSSRGVLVNDGTGHFTTLAYHNFYGGDIELGDLDGDQDLDVLVVNSSTNNGRVWINDGSGTFVDSGQSLAVAVAHEAKLGDLDGDHDLDAIITSTTGGGYTRVFRNQGGGVFTDSGQTLGTQIGVNLGDLDGDGDLDAFLSRFSGSTTAQIWFNESYDFGDAMTISPNVFPTTLAEDGARHRAAGPRLGTVRDGEADGVHSPWSDADDLTGTPDDEDGVTFSTLRPGEVATFTIDLQQPAAGGNYLNAWIDYNLDGDWNDAGEQIFTDYPLGTAAGSIPLALTIPWVYWGYMQTRFRLSSQTGLAATGSAPDGEVEDYRIYLQYPNYDDGNPTTDDTYVVGVGPVHTPTADFGDAPAPYPATLADNGAWHRATGPRLGANRDVETDGQPNAGATGDDFHGLADEDGFSFGRADNALLAGRVATFGVSVTQDCRLDVWVDLDQNGSWLDAGEHLVSSVNRLAGPSSLAVVIPATATGGYTYARVRVSTAGSATPTGPASDGEVQDYRLFVDTPPVSVPGGPYIVDLGNGIALDGGGSSDPEAGAGDSIGSYRWSVHDDALVLTGTTPWLDASSVSSLGAGTFPVTLEVTDTYGLTHTASTTLTIYDNRPVASFTATPNPVLLGNSITLDGSASTHLRPDRQIESWVWQIDYPGVAYDRTAYGTVATHTPEIPGWFTVTLRVTDNNDPPKNATASQQVYANAPPDVQLTGPEGSITDAERGQFHWVVTDLEPTTVKVVVVRDGVQVYENLNAPHDAWYPLQSYPPATNDITITATDSYGVSTTVTRSATVVDDDPTPPVAILGGSEGTQSDSEDQRFTWDLSDVGSGLLGITVRVNRNSANIYYTNDLSNAVGSFNFNSLGLGDYELAVVASDNDRDGWNGDWLATTETRTVHVVDDDPNPPQITLDGPTGSQSHMLPQSFAWEASDVSGMVQFSAAVTRDGMEIYRRVYPDHLGYGSGSFNFDSYGPGIFQLTVQATDYDLDWSGGDSLSNSATRLVTVTNTAPSQVMLRGGTAVWVDENSPGGTDLGPLTSLDDDPGESLLHAYSIVGGSSLFEVVGKNLQVAPGADLNFEAATYHDLVVRATDTLGATLDATFRVNLNDRNEGPTDLQLIGQTVHEHAAGAIVGNLSGVDPDAGDTLTFTVSDARFEVVGGVLKLRAGESLDVVAEPTVSLAITATDLGGLPYTESFTITVNGVNDPPTFVLAATETASHEDAGPVSVPSWAQNMLAGPSDESGQAMHFEVSVDSQSAGLVFASPPSIDSAGTLTYQAAADSHGSAVVRVTLVDSGPHTPPDDNTSVARTFTLVVAPVNDAPRFTLSGNPPTVLANAGAQTVVAFAGDFSAGPDDESDQTLTIETTVVSTQGPLTFSAPPAIDLVTGNLTYTAAPNAFGSATVQVTLRDSGGNVAPSQNSSVLAFTITVQSLTPVSVVNGDLVVRGTSGNDTITFLPRGTKSAVIFNGRYYAPLTLGATGRLIAYGYEGNDTIQIRNATNRVAEFQGGPGHDLLSGSSGPDILSGEDGDDRLGGNSGNDLLRGGEGDDRLYGDAGNDQLDGDNGEDVLRGESGNDILRGGKGSDLLYGGLGADILLGGEGDDTLYGESGRDLLIGGSGADSLRGGADEDILLGGASTHEANDSALLAILAEWNVSSRSNASRRFNIARGWGLAQGYRLDRTTVQDDFAIDLLSGEKGVDWLFASLGASPDSFVSATGDVVTTV